MARSRKKGPYVAHHLQEKLDRLNQANKKETIKTWSRRSTITLDFIGHTLLIHDGKKFAPVFIDENMLDHKLGEFAPTRKFGSHSSKKKK